MKISVISGGFDPIHSGHIAYINSASKLGDKLVILLNSDEWLRKKKDQEFMDFLERKTILESLKNVDEVIGFEDDDLGSCINGLEKLKNMYPNDEIIFCNGGDRHNENIPEMNLKGIHFEFGVGGNDKLNSSSWILKNWSYPVEERIWGKFFNLFQDEKVKVKELIVQPSKGMSFQRHHLRSEFWLISKGKCRVNFSDDAADSYEEYDLGLFDTFSVPLGSWHQITNPFDEPCHIIEIQYGKKNIEEDIERLRLYEEK